MVFATVYASQKDISSEKLAEIFASQRNRFVSFVERNLGDSEPEDTVQDTFLRMLCYIADGGHIPERSVVSNIYINLRNSACDKCRRRNSLPKSVCLDDLSEEPSDFRGNPLQELAKREDLNFVSGFLGRIDRRTSRMIGLHFEDGMTYKQIGYISGFSESGAHSVIDRALREARASAEAYK